MNRFYSVAAFFAGVTLLLGGLAAQRSALVWTMLACLFAAVSLLTHTVSVVLFPMLFVGVLAARYAETGAVPRRVVLVFVITGVVLGALFLLYLKPLIQGWNRKAAWGYSVGHAVLASVNLLGWPVTLLAGLGLVLMFAERAAQRWYWLASVGGWAAVAVALPLVVPYHAWYAFPFALTGLVLAGFAIGDMHERLRSTGHLASAAWICAALSLNLPAWPATSSTAHAPTYELRRGTWANAGSLATADASSTSRTLWTCSSSSGEVGAPAQADPAPGSDLCSARA